MQQNIQKRLNTILITSAIAIFCLIASTLLQASANPQKGFALSTIGCFASCILGFTLTIFSLFSLPRSSNLTHRQHIYIIFPLISAFFTLIISFSVIDTFIGSFYASIPIFVIPIISLIALARFTSNNPPKLNATQKISADTEFSSSVARNSRYVLLTLAIVIAFIIVLSIIDIIETLWSGSTQTLTPEFTIILLLFPLSAPLIYASGLICAVVVIINIIALFRNKNSNPTIRKQIYLYLVLNAIFSALVTPYFLISIVILLPSTNGVPVVSTPTVLIIRLIALLVISIYIFLPKLLHIHLPQKPSPIPQN